MVTQASALDLPDLSWLDDPSVPHDEQHAATDAAARTSWLARNIFGYSVLHYDDVVAMLRDKRWHSAAGQLLELSGVDDAEWLARRRTSILSAEGDEHTRLRRLVGPAFSPRHADSFRASMRSVVTELLDTFTERGHADLAVEFCEPYPIPIICELFGAPKSDWQLFSTWATDIFRIFNGNLIDDKDTIIAAEDALDAYVSELIEARRGRPTDDLLSALIAAEAEGDRLSREELQVMCEAILMAGTDTTRNQLGCSLVLFAQHPEQWALLAERPELAPRAVEETMRYFGTVRATGRFASDDIEYRGVVFPKGTFLAPSLATANRDPAVFTEPLTFDITREPPDKPQLTFGSGIHYCLGAALARAEQQEALTILAQRLPDLTLTGDVTWKLGTAGIFGPDRLPAAFTPTPSGPHDVIPRAERPGQSPGRSPVVRRRWSSLVVVRRRQSSAEGRRRVRFTSPRRCLPAMRRSFEPRVGLVARRGRSTWRAPRNRSTRRCSAIARLRSWLRSSSTTSRISGPSRSMMRCRCPGPNATELATSNRRSTRVFERLAC